MVDNSSIPVASGNETFANNDIGGVKYPRQKSTWGPAGTANDTDIASGKALPIQVRSATGLIPIGEPTDAKSTATDTTSVSAISIWKQISASVQTLATSLASVYTAAQAMAATFQLVDVPTDGTAAQRPVAVAHGSNPTAVAAAAKTVPVANRAGIPFTIGGHPNVIAKSHRVLASDGAQTDLGLTTVTSGAKIVITQIWLKSAKATSVSVAVKIGFGTANVPTPALAGVAGLIFDESVGPGEGHQIGNGAGIVAVGADAEDLRLTCDSPTSGNLTVGYSYYTIES